MHEPTTPTTLRKKQKGWIITQVKYEEKKHTRVNTSKPEQRFRNIPMLRFFVPKGELVW
jgi:hypothetical protein